MRVLIAEAKRRHVFRTAGLYAGAAFAVLQTADIVLPTLGLGESAITYLLFIIAAGFPLALVLAWVLDVSGDGIKVTPEVSASEKLKLSGPRLVDGIIVVLALGVGFMYLERFTSGQTVATADPTAAVEAANLEPSIAVLPFENLSTSEENAYFAAGIHEDILNNLSKIGELIVTSRTSTLAYAGSSKPIPIIARELGVNYVIEGSVRRAGDRVRISVQLIEAGSDSHVWSESYDRAIVDVFEIQQQVADEVSHALKVQFDIGLAAGEKPTKSLEAYELFLESRILETTQEPDNIERAVAGYRRALEIDPDYADAWAGLSIALNSMGLFGKADREMEEANIAADKALALAPDSWMSNYAKARYLGREGMGSPSDSLPYFEKAIAINPNDGDLLANYGFDLWFAGDARKAMDQFLAAYRRDPLSANANMARAMVALFESDRITTEKFIKRAIDINPDSTYINWWAGAAFSTMLDYEMSLQQFGRVLTLNPNHLGSMLWTASIFTTLGYYEGADYWLDRAEAIAPNNPQYLARRANNYSLGGEVGEYQALVEGWIRQDPQNREAQRYLPYATARTVRKAWDNEDMQAFKTFSRKSLDENLAYLNSEADEQGNLVVRFITSFNFLAAAINARNLGDDVLADKLANDVIEFYESQPPGAFNARNLQMMLAYALIGDKDQAITYARTMGDESYRAIWLLDAGSFDVRDDPYDIYNGLGRNIAFQDVVATLMQKNVDTLDRLRAAVPNIFPPQG